MQSRFFMQRPVPKQCSLWLARSIVETKRPSILAVLLLAQWRQEDNGFPKFPKHPIIIDPSNPRAFIEDVMTSCRRGFATAGEDKVVIGEVLLSEMKNMHENEKQAQAALDVWNVLKENYNKLTMGDADYLGHFYETFFTYIGARNSPAKEDRIPLPISLHSVFRFVSTARSSDNLVLKIELWD